MHFQFLIEDLSGKALIENVMQKLVAGRDDITYDCKAFKGIGGLSKSTDILRAKTNKLLNDLDIFLKGFDKALQCFPSVLVIVLDNDARNVESFRTQLENKASSLRLSVDYTFCIAVEEMEAWLLGDVSAIRAVYPDVRMSVIKDYKQDSICGTWEILADSIYSGGISRFKKDCPTYREIGNHKYQWAKEIGAHLDLEHNCSPSFNYFLGELTKRLSTVA